MALLLAGPALSLPSMLVIRSILGTRKTVVYIALIVVMATVSGLVYGAWFQGKRSEINSPVWECDKEQKMTTLQILGPGCPKCRKLAENTEAAAKRLGIPYRMEKVTDIVKIMAFGVMMTPALAVDGVVKVSGKIPPPEEIERLLASA